MLFLDVFGDGVDPTDAESGAQTKMQHDANQVCHFLFFAFLSKMKLILRYIYLIRIECTVFDLATDAMRVECNKDSTQPAHAEPDS